LEKVISKTITAFMNSEGGALFIGVDDDGNVIGLENDYQSLKKKDSDGFELEIRQSIEKYLKNKIVNEFLKLKFHNIESKEICEIIITPAPMPVFLYNEEGRQECFVRVGNSSLPYNYEEFYQYCNRHFKK
jgi:predicted HTH transcriptional regulator